MNLAMERLTTTFDPDVIDAAGIAATVDGLGYTATLLSESGTGDEVERRRRQAESRSRSPA